MIFFFFLLIYAISEKRTRAERPFPVLYRIDDKYLILPGVLFTGRCRLRKALVAVCVRVLRLTGICRKKSPTRPGKSDIESSTRTTPESRLYDGNKHYAPVASATNRPRNDLLTYALCFFFI